ncbi:hypothetical protein DRJ25_04590 [Candidatus Woesearchaeota archaeon]|nr:MAG: hypothetical protein DRJ25_04590 [Candidatus Woesearchaeota archaeon]
MVIRPDVSGIFAEEKELILSDLELIRNLFIFLDENAALLDSILNFKVEKQDVKSLFGKLKEIADSLKIAELREREAFSDIIKTFNLKAKDTEVFLALLKDQESLVKDIIELDLDLNKKKYSQDIINRKVGVIRNLVRRQKDILKKHENVISALLGRISEGKEKIERLLKETFGRVCSKRGIKDIRKSLILDASEELVPCFVLTSKIEGLIENIHEKKSKDKLISMFRNIGVRTVQGMVLFTIDPSQDISIFADIPPVQPQRVEGIIEKKLPGKTLIRIVDYLLF